MTMSSGIFSSSSEPEMYWSWLFRPRSYSMKFGPPVCSIISVASSEMKLLVPVREVLTLFMPFEQTN